MFKIDPQAIDSICLKILCNQLLSKIKIRIFWCPWNFWLACSDFKKYIFQYARDHNSLHRNGKQLYECSYFWKHHCRASRIIMWVAFVCFRRNVPASPMSGRGRTFSKEREKTKCNLYWRRWSRTLKFTGPNSPGSQTFKLKASLKFVLILFKYNAAKRFA